MCMDDIAVENKGEIGMKELEAYQKMMSNLPKGIQAAEVEAEKNDQISAGRVNGVESGMSASDKTALFVRVTAGKTGMTYTQNLESDPSEVLQEALANADFVQADGPELMNYGDENKFEATKKQEEHVPLSVLTNKSKELETKAKELLSEEGHFSVMVTENLRTMGIVNSHGLYRVSTKRIAEADMIITCENGVHRSIEMQTSAPSVDAIDANYFLRKIKEWMQLPMNKVQFSTASIPAVLDGSVMCNIFLTAWQMFSGISYLNQNTPFYGKLGEKMFPSILNISDFSVDPETGYGRQFDCEGTSSRTVELVKEGKFNELMLNLTSARELGQESTGNAGRDTSLFTDQMECKVIPSNFTLHNGTHTKEELLGALEDGIYIFESYDMFHSVNVASGDFAIPCRGIRYHQGKPIGKVDGITIKGTLTDLFMDIEKMADDKTTVSMVMSKSFAVAAPSVLVKKIQVTGMQEEEK